MSAQDGPPQGMETKNVPSNTPGYVPAQVVNSDHPGHMGTKDQGGFAGTAGYTNTPGIGEPEPAETGGKQSEGTTAKKTTTSKSTSS